MVKILLPLSLFLIISLFASAYSSDSDNFLDCLKEYNASGIVYSQTNGSFTEILDAYVKNKRYERSSTNKPTLILTPTSEDQVSAAVHCAATNKIHIKSRSGGHDYEGLSYVSEDGFIILDMFNFRTINVYTENNTAYVEAGALLGELYYKIAEKSGTLGFPAGICPTVAVGGHISGAGYGNMLRRFGLSVDNLHDARVVVANGSILKTTKGEDLFWAISGGGGASFAVILSYTLNLVTVPPNVTVFRVERYRSEKAAEILYDYQKAIPYFEDSLFIRVLLQPATVTKNKNKTNTVRTTYIAMYLGSAKSLMNNVINPNFPTLGLNETDCKEMSWIDSVLYWGYNDNTTKREALLNRSTTADDFGYLKRKSDYVKSTIEISDLEKIFNVMTGKKIGMVFNTYGGRMAKILNTTTAFPHREGNLFKIQYSVTWRNATSEKDDDEYLQQIRDLYNATTPYVSYNPREAFLNYRDLDIGTNGGLNDYNIGKVYGEKYFKGNFDRLVKIKTAVDPDNFFRNEQSIPTANH